ncbi:helix-turn-helix domain-containing protein [Streptomyces termitum]|uniref:helix-turn-helix domain-containing protein n=1 Tax=Streptomyces termitum TaxID=67368 RepID=UPI0037A52966
MAKDPAVEEFAARVRALKARDGRSYEALGRRLGVSASTLHRYCSGEAVPEGFAPVARLAALCGASAGETASLEAAWTRADRARRPPTPVPAPGPEAPAPEAGEPSGPAQRDGEEGESGGGPGNGPEAGPASGSEGGSEAGPVSGPGAVPAPGAASVGASPVGLPSGGRWGRWGWRGLGGGALAVVVAVLVGAVLLPRERAEPPAPAPPLTWTASSHVWRNGCGHTYLVDRAPGRVPAPPPPADARRWAAARGAVDGGETLVRVSVQGTGDAAVVLQALHVRVVGRAAPLPWPAYRMDQGCGGAVTPRLLDVDLDRPRPVARPVDGFDASGQEGRTLPAVSFPYAVTAAGPEELLVAARTAGCDCRWFLELEWSAAGRRGTVRIGDEGGRPFRTSGVVGRPSYGYDSGGRAWITDGESGQVG